MNDRLFARMWTIAVIVLCVAILSIIGLGGWALYLLATR